MKTHTYGNVLLVLLGMSLLSACSNSDAPAEDTQAEESNVTAPEVDAVALVNDWPISRTDVRLHALERKNQGKRMPDSEVIEELINLKVIVLSAEKAGFHESPEAIAEINRQRDTLLANLYINQRMSEIDISDDDLQAEYDRQLAELAAVEYNASHILLNTREDAMAAIERLEDGEEFGRVASEMSTGPSAENGGELGWFRMESMVPEFSRAVETLDEGEYTEEPVKTGYGWHVIRLTGKRDIEHPPLEKVRDQVLQLVTNNRLNDLVKSLREDFQVEYK